MSRSLSPFIKLLSLFADETAEDTAPVSNVILDAKSLRVDPMSFIDLNLLSPEISIFFKLLISVDKRLPIVTTLLILPVSISATDDAKLLIAIPKETILVPN